MQQDIKPNNDIKNGKMNSQLGHTNCRKEKERTKSFLNFSPETCLVRRDWETEKAKK